MASQDRIDQLTELVSQAGSTRNAERLIKGYKDVAPTHSALYKAMKGSATTDYVIQCYIDDLTAALKQKTKGAD